ncbi:MAG: hypothetical protein HQM09_17485 [Candidatus Riflebacteria bacterium]|nr:hypothetical protein [Candidatus Riflebacteria bacterium]
MDALRKLVLNFIEKHGRNELAGSLGFRNAKKCSRHLDGFISGRYRHAEFLVRLARVFGLDEFELLAQAKQEEADSKFRLRTRAEIIARADFRPYVRVLTTPLVQQGSGWHYNFMVNRSFQEMSLPVDFEKCDICSISAIIRRHFTDHRGEIRFFGQIVGYAFQRTFEEA